MLDKKRKIKDPKLTHLEEKSFVDSCKKNELEYGIFKDTLIESPLKVQEVTIDSCVFQNINFTNVLLEDVDMVDVIFEYCDLSNHHFDKKLLGRVIFKN